MVLIEDMTVNYFVGYYNTLGVKAYQELMFNIKKSPNFLVLSLNMGDLIYDTDKRVIDDLYIKLNSTEALCYDVLDKFELKIDDDKSFYCILIKDTIY